MRCLMTALVASLTIVSLSGFAGQSKISGVGRVSAPADYVSLQISVHSECWSSPGAASSANDLEVTQLMGFLKDHVDLSEGSRDALLANGGFTMPFSRTFYPLGGRDSETLCLGTFQKVTKIVLKSTDVANFSRKFTQIQARVLPRSRGGVGNDVDVPVTYVTMSQPSPELFHETRQAKEKLALKSAKLDAVEKFEAIVSAGNCKVESYRIAEMSEPGHTAQTVPYARASESSFAGGSDVPVVFDEHWVNRELVLTFWYRGGNCPFVGEPDMRHWRDEEDM